MKQYAGLPTVLNMLVHESAKKRGAINAHRDAQGSVLPMEVEGVANTRGVLKELEVDTFAPTTVAGVDAVSMTAINWPSGRGRHALHMGEVAVVNMKDVQRAPNRVLTSV